MRFYIILFCLAFLFNGISQNAKDSVIELTLKQSQDYALKNSPLTKNANLDIESAKKKIWETTTIGLPQINSTLNYSYMLTIPDKIEQFSGLTQLGSWMYGVDQYLYMTSGNPAFGHISAPDPNQEIVTDKDLRWGLTYDITLSEIIFNGAYLVGLQTSKIYQQLSEQSAVKTQNDVLEQVANAYFLVLIAKENKDIMDSIYYNTQKTLDYIVSMNKQGLLEETDVDQMQLTLSSVKNVLDMLTRQTEIALNLLKFQLGIELSQKLNLSDNLTILLQTSELAGLALKEFKVENNADYKLIETQEKLSFLNVKLQKSALLPDIVGFYTHQENFNKNSFSFTPPNLFGFSMNIPIFGSGMKLSKISQAKISMEKISNTKQQLSSGLQISFVNARASFITAFNNYTTKKQNVILAQKIYNKSIIKYKEGIIGSMELTISQNQYLQTQTDYYSSIIELSTAKSKLEKLLK